MDVGGIELLELVGQRRELLDVLASEPLERSALVERVDASRPTVHRALRELEPAGLVRRTAAGYETTLAGRLLVDLHDEYAARADDVAAASDPLAALPASAPVDSRLVAGCERRVVDGTWPADVERALASADRVQAVLGRTPSPLSLSRWERRALGADLRLELVVDERLYERLVDDHPRLLRTHAATGNTVHVGPTPPFDLLVAEGGDGTLVVVVPHAAPGGEPAAGGDDRDLPVDVLSNDTPAAVEWARERVERSRAAARDVTADARQLSAAADGGAGDPRRVLAAAGFETVTPETLADRDPPPLATGWRTGLDLAAVDAGHAVDREYVVGGRTDGAGGNATTGEAPGEDATPGDAGRDVTPGDAAAGPDGSPDSTGPAAPDATPGERRDLAADLVAGLADGTHHAVVGPPGSGKSTVCKAVAVRWAREHGPVLYREDGDAFEALAALLERVADLDGPVLVVVEDAVRPDASAVFEALPATEGTDAVFLFDAVESEWPDPPGEVPPAADAARVRAVRSVPMPPLDERTVERFVDRFEATTDRSVESDPADLLAAVRGADSGAGAAPGELLLLLHRLTRRTSTGPGAAAGDDPAATADGDGGAAAGDDLAAPVDGDGGAAAGDDPAATADGETSLDAAVAGAYREVAAAGDAALRVAVAVNLLNAAGREVTSALAHAAVDDPPAVETALDALTGRALFPADGDGFRTVHETWSRLFLAELLADRGEDAAAALFGEVLSALLALADDPARRERAATAAGDPSALAEVAAAPREWASGLVESAFGVGRERPALAPLFGDVDDESVALPEVCPRSLAVRTALWRGLMARAAGDLDRAERAFERVLARADDLGGEAAAELRARALTERGMVAFRRGDADAAESDFRASLERYRDLGDRARVAENRKRLGNVAWMRGDLRLAADRYRESLATYRDLDDRLGAAYVRHNLGNVVDARGDADAAEEHYRAALSTYRAVGDRRDEADCLNNLGVLAENRGDLAAAADYYARARDRHREVGARVGVANATHNLGVVARKRGDLDAAADHARGALSAFEAAGDDGGVVVATRLLASVARERGDLDAAADHAERSRGLADELGDHKERATALTVAARVARDRGDLDRARSLAEAALAAERESGQPRGEVSALRALASVERERGEHDAARERLAGALSLVEDLADDHREAAVLDERGRLDRDRGRHARAADRFEEAADLYADAGADGRAVDARLRLVASLAALGDEDGARRQAERARDRAADAGLDDRRSTAERRLASLSA